MLAASVKRGPLGPGTPDGTRPVCRLLVHRYHVTNPQTGRITSMSFPTSPQLKGTVRDEQPKIEENTPFGAGPLLPSFADGPRKLGVHGLHMMVVLHAGVAISEHPRAQLHTTPDWVCPAHRSVLCARTPGFGDDIHTCS